MSRGWAGWAASRAFWLLWFLFFFANTGAGPVSVFGLLLSAGVQGLFLRLICRAAGSRERRGEQKWKGWWKAAAFLLMACVQGCFFFLAGGWPADGEAFRRAWQGLPAAGEVILAHWRPAVLAGMACADLAVGIIVLYSEGGLPAFYLLFLLLGCSPWLLVPQPAVYLTPLAAGAAVWLERRKEGRSRALGLAALAAVLAAAIGLSGWGGVLESGSEGLLLSWFQAVKDGFADGSFGWSAAPALTPFGQNGWALRLQNTIYPGADRYGWYALAVQGAWGAALTGLAFGAEPEKGVEKAVFLAAAAILLPLAASGGCGPLAVCLPWLAAQAAAGGNCWLHKKEKG